MCYVFLQAETFALRGGPNQAGGPKVVGSYSGVMIETTGTGDVGLFLLNAAAGGASSGQMVLFTSSGSTSGGYNCTIVGLSDTSRGGSGKFIGVFSGISPVPTSGTIQSVAGQITATVLPSSSSIPRLVGTATSRTSSTSTVVIGIGLPPPTVTGPVRQYIVDGWNTSSFSNSGTSLALP